MKLVQVTGRFVDEHKNLLEGEIEFIPERIWVECDGETYPAQHIQQTLVNGRFVVYLTPTDTEDLYWYYIVKCPLGEFRVQIEGSGPIKLVDLLPNRFA